MSTKSGGFVPRSVPVGRVFSPSARRVPTSLRSNIPLGLNTISRAFKTISFKDLVGTGKKEINFSDVDIEKAKDYAAEDADITFRLYKKFYKSLKEEKMINIYENICNKYPIYSIEDALNEEDYDGWTEITKKLGSKIC